MTIEITRKELKIIKEALYTELAYVNKHKDTDDFDSDKYRNLHNLINLMEALDDEKR